MRKNKLALALTASLGLGAFASSAQAISLAENGVGDFAYIPYFTTAPGKGEWIKIINTSNQTVAAKITFRRGTDSLEVRDFIIFLSPKDFWSGMILPISNGANAKIVTSDTSCTVPNKPSWVNEGSGSYSVAFDSTRYGSAVSVASSYVDGNTTSIGNISEGYVTVAEIGTFPVGAESVVNSVPYLVKHVNKVPRDCGAIDAAYSTLAPATLLQQVQSQFSANTANVLKVSAVAFDTIKNEAFGVPVTTIASAFGGISFPKTVAGDDSPKESNMDTAFNVFDNNTATLFSGTKAGTGRPEETVSSVLMNNSIYGSYDATSINSSWIVTFPTKKALFDNTPQPNTPIFNPTVQIGWNFYDAEESVPATQAAVGVTPFSPYTAPAVVTPNTPTLKYEVNVINFSATNALASNLTLTAGQPSTFVNGWAQLGFLNSKNLAVASGYKTAGATSKVPAVAPSTAAGSFTFTGLPVIGFEYFEVPGASAANAIGYSKSIQ